MSNIRVKGGNINYEIVKDLSVDDQMSRIQFYINQILNRIFGSKKMNGGI